MTVDKWGYHIDFEAFCESGLVDSSYFDGKKVLVTGATGLIGSAFLDFLIFLKQKKLKDLTIYALTRNISKLEEKFRFALENKVVLPLVQDITSPLPDNIKVDLLVHAASIASPNLYLNEPVNTINTTVLGTKNILDHATQCGAKVIYLSTVEVYGETIGISDDVKEDQFGVLDCNMVRSSYPESKRLAETLCKSYFKQFGTKVIIARPCKIYGPSNNSSDKRVMAHILNTIKNGADITLNSDGSRVFSFCYVTDVVSALAVLLKKGVLGDAYNISDSNSIASLKEIAKYCGQLAKVKVSFGQGAGIGVSKDAVINSSKLESLSWKPLTDIYQGLEKQFNSLN